MDCSVFVAGAAIMLPTTRYVVMDNVAYKMNDDIWSIIKEYLGIISKEQFDIIMEFFSELPGVIEHICSIEERRI